MLITEAPLSTALAIASPEASQVISPSVPGRGLQRDVERPRARPDAEDADAVLRRGGDGHRRGAVRVVDRRARERGDVRVARPLRVGEVGGGVHERDQRALRRDRRRRQRRVGDVRAPVVGRAGERVVGDACSDLRRTLACA